MSLILTVNGGSSSLKCALFIRYADHDECLYRFRFSNILEKAQVLIRRDKAFGRESSVEKNDLPLSEIPREERHQACLKYVMEWIDAQFLDGEISAFGHRVVHGGETFTAPVLVTDDVMQELEQLIPLAPLHQPYNLKLIEVCQQLVPSAIQVASFDTMFHHGHAPEEKYYAIPREYSEAGIHKYGFHGLSYEFINHKLNELPEPDKKANTIVCHLGAGASMCAIKDGQSVASSMGFTAVEGLPMGTRCGTIDPGVLLFLQRHYQLDNDQLENVLYQQSGWLGVSGESADMLTLRHSDNPHAQEAIDMFCYRAALEIGRLSAALGGLQQLVFTGGVGENDSYIREQICQRSAWLGVKINDLANSNNLACISTSDSSVSVRVIATNEEAMIARHTEEVMDWLAAREEQAAV